MIRKKIIAGNWKMNADKNEAVALVNGILANYNDYNLSEYKIVVVAAPFPYIHYCASMFTKFPFMFAAAQNCSEHEKGAYTGEVSAKIIASLDVKYIIIGHSERRQFFNETNTVLLQKIQQAQKQNLISIFCCGEQLEDRNQNKQFEVVKKQLEESLFHLDQQLINEVIIAYEPVWAIGTGVTASNSQAQEMHAFIRQLLREKYSKGIAEEISILYGGSVNAQNAHELFEENDIDGALVGGASLKESNFTSIIQSLTSKI